MSAICSKVADDGSTWLRMPRRAKLRGVLVLMPRSSAATVKRCVAFGFDDVGAGGADLAGQVGAQHRRLAAHPLAAARPASASASPEKTPAFIEPRLRRCRTTARVSMPAIPTMRWRTSSSSSVPVARQLEARGDGSRTA